MRKENWDCIGSHIILVMATNITVLPKSYRFPKALTDEINAMSDEANPFLYMSVWRLVADLDDLDLLNDQICFTALEDGSIDIEWPNYGLYYDFREIDVTTLKDYGRVRTSSGVFQDDGIRVTLYYNLTKTSARLVNYETGKTLLVSILERVVDSDVYDTYRKDKRTNENTETILLP